MIRLIILDIDGTLTDGGIYLGSNQMEFKRFSVADGLGVKLAQAAGKKVVIITGRKSEAVERRAKELAIDTVLQGFHRKIDALNHILQEESIEEAEIAVIGDDLPDLPLMRRCGTPIAVQNAVDSVKKQALYITQKSGGNGAVREAIEWILTKENLLEIAIQKFLGE